MKKEIFTVIDFETTGLDYQVEQIIEVAAITTDGERELGRLQLFVELKPGKELPEFITSLTGIKSEDLEGGADEEDAVEALYYFMENTTVIAQNAPFDFSFMSNYGVYPSRFVCTRALSRLVEPDQSASLKNVCERHGIDLTGHHRAENDIAATLEVFKLMRSKAEAAGIEYRNKVVDAPERPLSFRPLYAEVIKIEQ